MSTDIPRTRSTQAGTRQPGLPPPAELSENAARMDKLDNDQFEKQAAELLKPTAGRPALFVEDEIEKIRTGYSTGAGRLHVLNQVRAVREAYLVKQAGEQPFDPLSEGDHAKAELFFKTHGMRLLSEPRQAPPNPIRMGSAQTEAQYQANIAAARQTPAEAATSLNRAMANVGKPTEENAAAYQANQAAKLIAAAEVPGALRGPVPASPAASLEIHYLSAQGFECTLKMHAPSSAAVLEQGESAMKKLLSQLAKPLPAAPLVQAAPAGAAAVGHPSGEIPKCPYHGVAMKPSRQPGAFYCPKKKADGGYCDYKVGGE